MVDYLRKTESEIERDLFRLVKASDLVDTTKGGISGNVYRRGMRPLDAHTEDIVITFVSGEESQEQNGVINLNIYVPKISIGSSTNKVQDISRCESLERLVIDFVDGIESTEYLYELRSSPLTLDDPEQLDQTLINTRLYFRRTTF